MALSKIFIFIVIVLIAIIVLDFLITPNRAENLGDSINNIQGFFIKNNISNVDEPIYELNLEKLSKSPEDYLGKEIKTELIMSARSRFDGIYYVYDGLGNEFQIEKLGGLNEGRKYEIIGRVKKDTRVYHYNRVEFYYIQPNSIKKI